MNLQKLLLSLFILVITLGASGQKRTVELSGNITGLKGRQVAIFGSDNFTTPIVTTTGNNDFFKLTVEVGEDESAPYYLHIPAIGDFHEIQYSSHFMLFLDQSPIELEAIITETGIDLKSVKGSPLMDESDRLHNENEYTLPLIEATTALNNAIEAYHKPGGDTEANETAMNDAEDLVYQLEQQRAKAFVDMISKYPKSKALADHVTYLSEDLPVEEKKNILNSFDPSIHNCYVLRSFAESILKAETTLPGEPLPDFDTYTADGKLDKLSNYRGQYLLIDFWASWCGPCIEEMPNIAAIYKDYKNQGLQVIGVSLDASKENWLESVKELKLEYHQLWDNEEKSWKLFDIKGIPFVILVSPEGIILERNLRGEAIRQKVAQYLKNK